MSKWLKAIQLSIQILNALSNVAQELPADIHFEWKGQKYKLSFSEE